MNLSLLVSFLLSQPSAPPKPREALQDGIPDWERTPAERLSLKAWREPTHGSIFLPR